MDSHLDTLQVATLLPELAILEEEVNLRDRAVAVYTQELTKAGITVPFTESHDVGAYTQCTVRMKNRNAVRMALEVADIPTAVHHPTPLNKQPAVASNTMLPVDGLVAGEVLNLPTHSCTTEGQVWQVVGALVQALSR